MSTFAPEFPTRPVDGAFNPTNPDLDFTHFLNPFAEKKVAPDTTATETSDDPVVEDDVNRLIDPDNPQQPILEPNKRLVIGVSTRGSALTDVLDKLLVQALDQFLEQFPLVDQTDKQRKKLLKEVVAEFKTSPVYTQLLDKLNNGQAGVKDIEAKMNEWVGTILGGKVEGIGFDPANAIGFELWVPPLSDEALENFSDGEGDLVGDLVGYLKDTVGNGFLNIKVFPEEFAKIPGMPDEAKTRLITSVLTYTVSTLGAVGAGTELESIASEFVQSTGTIFSGDTARGTNFQVGFPIRGFKGTGDSKIGLNEVWFTALNYNLPVVPDDGSGLYLGYSDLRRLVLKPDAEGDWDIAQFISADRAIELGFNFNTPTHGDASKPGKRRLRADGVGVHVGAIGTFAVYMDKEAVTTGQIRKLEDGTLGYLIKKNEDTFQNPTTGPEQLYFKPFNKQEKDMFENVFLTGDDKMSLDDVKLLPESTDFKIVTDADIAKASELSPTATWFAKAMANPDAQDFWTGGATMIPAFMTLNPYAISLAAANSYAEITQNQFNRSYTDVVNEYRGDDGKIAVERFVVEQLTSFGDDWDQIQALYEEARAVEGYEDMSLTGFLMLGDSAVIGEPNLAALDIQGYAAKASSLSIRIEQRMDNLQGYTTRLIREGYADATDLHATFTKYTRPDAEGAVAPPEGSELLFESITNRLFGKREPLVLAETDDGVITTGPGNAIANLMSLAIDTSRPEAFRILERTDSLKNLSDFKLEELDKLEDFETVAAFVETLSEKPEIDLEALYNQLHNGKWSDRANDIIAHGSDDLRQVAAVFNAVRGSYGEAHGPLAHIGLSTEPLEAPTRTDLNTFFNGYAGNPIREHPSFAVHEFKQQFNMDVFLDGIAERLKTDEGYDPELGTGIPVLDARLASHQARLKDTSLAAEDDPMLRPRLLAARTILAEIDETGISGLKFDSFEDMFEAASLPEDHIAAAAAAANTIAERLVTALGVEPLEAGDEIPIEIMGKAFDMTMELYFFGNPDSPNTTNAGFVSGGLAGAELALQSAAPLSDD